MMWIWISVGGVGMFTVCMIIGGIEHCLAERRYLAERETKMNKQKIHWYENMQQIMTDDGKCRYDKVTTEALVGDVKILDRRGHDNRDRIAKLEAELAKWDREDEGVKQWNRRAEEEHGRTQAQLQCSAKGHGKWVYVGVCGNMTASEVTARMTGKSYTFPFRFRCDKCGLEITKTKKELTPAEKLAAKTFNL